VNIRTSGRSRPEVRSLCWVAIAVSSAEASLGFGLVDSASRASAAIIQAVAAEALLTMIADEMAPDAFDRAACDDGVPEWRRTPTRRGVPCCRLWIAGRLTGEYVAGTGFRRIVNGERAQQVSSEDGIEPSAMTARSALFVGVGAMVDAGIFALLGQAGAIAGKAVANDRGASPARPTPATTSLAPSSREPLTFQGRAAPSSTAPPASTDARAHQG
jgi:hypothetical protein